jgi:hypothetical protein
VAAVPRLLRQSDTPYLRGHGPPLFIDRAHLQVELSALPIYLGPCHLRFLP